MPSGWTPNGGFYMPHLEREDDAPPDAAPPPPEPFLPGVSTFGDANPFAGLTIESRYAGAHGGEEQLGMPDERELLGDPSGLNAPPPTLSQTAGVPPVNARGQLTNGQGEPIMAGDSPVTLSQYHRAMMASTRGPTRSPASADAAAFNSSLRWAQTPEQQSALQGVIGERYGYLADLMGRAQADPSLTEGQRAQAVNHLYQQMGQLSAQHSNFAQEQQARQKAQAAGLHPDYGTPQGPELDPRARKDLADAEWALQQTRADPGLSVEQKLVAARTLGAKIDSLDPAGRYRNGRQPLSPAQQFAAQNLHIDEANGFAVAIDAKGTPHFHALAQAKGGGKEKAQGFDDLSFDQQHKMVLDMMSRYGVSAKEAIDHIRHHESLLRPGAAGGGPNYPDTPAGRAAAATQRDFDARQGMNQPLRPLKDVLAEQKQREQQAKDQEKAFAKWEADQAKAKKDQEAAHAKNEQHDQLLQTQSRTHAEQLLKYRAALKAKKDSEALLKGKVTPEEADPKDVEREAALEYRRRGGQGFYGVPLSHAPARKFLQEHVAPALEKVGDPRAAHYIGGLKTLLERHPRGMDSMSPEERGHWLHGMAALKTYDPTVGDLPSFEQIGAVDPEGR